MSLVDEVLGDVEADAAEPIAHLGGCDLITDLAPLQAMKLRTLFCNNTPVSSLAPLADMKLVALNCGLTKVIRDRTNSRIGYPPR